MTETKAERQTAWPWPHFHNRRAQRDAAVAQAEAAGQITTESSPADRDADVVAEEDRLASMQRAGDKLIAATPPPYGPFSEDQPRRSGITGVTSADAAPLPADTAPPRTAAKAKDDTAASS